MKDVLREILSHVTEENVTILLLLFLVLGLLTLVFFL